MQYFRLTAVNAMFVQSTKASSSNASNCINFTTTSSPISEADAASRRAAMSKAAEDRSQHWDKKVQSKKLERMASVKLLPKALKTFFVIEIFLWLLIGRRGTNCI
jgi:hypothetical protein